MGLKDIDPFMDTPEGRAFFPYHRLAPGYRLVPADEPVLKLFLRRLRWVSWGLIAVFLIAQPWLHDHVFPAFLMFFTISMSIWFAAVWFRCRGLPRTQQTMPPLQATRRAAAALSSGFIVYGLVVCALFFVGGVFMFVTKIGEPAMNLASILIFGFFWLVYCRIGWIKWFQHKRA